MVRLFRRRSAGPEELSLEVQDVFFIKLRDKGTVLVGQLQGEGELRPGDLVCHAGREFRLERIEAFNAERPEAGPGDNVGLVLGPGAPPDPFRGARLGFRRG